MAKRVVIVCDCCGSTEATDMFIEQIAEDTGLTVDEVHEGLYDGDGVHWSFDHEEYVLEGCTSAPVIPAGGDADSPR